MELTQRLPGYGVRTSLAYLMDLADQFSVLTPTEQQIVLAFADHRSASLQTQEQEESQDDFQRPDVPGAVSTRTVDKVPEVHVGKNPFCGQKNWSVPVTDLVFKGFAEHRSPYKRKKGGEEVLMVVNQYVYTSQDRQIFFTKDGEEEPLVRIQYGPYIGGGFTYRWTCCKSESRTHKEPQQRAQKQKGKPRKKLQIG